MRLQGLLPEKDPLEVGGRVKGVGRNGTDLVILQVQVFKGRGQPLGDLCQLVPSDVQQLQRRAGDSRTPTCAELNSLQAPTKPQSSCI